MASNWITLYPQWFLSEQNAIASEYPDFRIDQGALRGGILCYYGELIVRPSSGTKRHAIRLTYPEGSPYELPIVTPLKSMPEFNDSGGIDAVPNAVFFNRRHQMSGGSLCLFQRETRGHQGGELINAVDVLARAEDWFRGYHTGRWPPDSHQSELESHFAYAGEVLLSKTFYAEEIGKSGRFFMVHDVRRIIDGSSDESPPLIVTVITNQSEAGELIHDAREDLASIYPWIANECWSPNGLIELEQGNRDELSLLVAKHGHWWALDEEPQPFHDGKGLLRLLEKVAPDGDSWKLVSEALGNEVSTESSHFIALGYPSRDEGFEWLVLTVAKEETKLLAGSEERRRERFERARVGAIHVNGAQPSSIQLRNTGVVNSNVREKTVALIGLGALGSRVAELLAQAGVGKFILCDLDRMNTGNVARHVGGLTDFGAKKTDVVMRRIFNINPHLQIVRFWDGSALASLDGFADFISSADVVVSTVADENVESAMNQMAVIGDKTVVYGRAMRRGSMGRVFAVRPRIDACKTCIGLHARDARDGLKTGSDWIEVTEREEDVLIHECGRPVIPASAIDLSFIASLTARVALDLLEGSQLVENHWVWSR